MGSLPIIPLQHHGELVVDTEQLQGVRDAMAELGVSGELVVNPSAPSAPCVAGPGNACLSLDFNAGSELEPKLVTTVLAELPALALPGLPVPLDATDAQLLDLLNPGGPGAPFSLTIAHDPTKIDVSRRDRENGSFEVGVWFPITITFPAGTQAKFLCDCNDPVQSPYKEWPTLPPDLLQDLPAGYQTCESICERFWEGTVEGFGCSEFYMSIRLNRVQLWLGFVPEKVGTLPNGGWTKGVFSGKDFHTKSMYRLRPVIAGRPDFAWKATGDIDALDLALADTSHDGAVGVYVDCDIVLGSVCDIIDCDEETASTVSSALGRGLYKSLRTQLQKQIQDKNAFTFDSSKANPFSGAPCALDTSGCTQDQLEQFAAASLTYQVWDWFYGPFGPYTNGSWLEITAVDSYVEPVVDPDPFFDFPHHGSPATLTFHYDADYDNDGALNPFDNCPFVANHMQENADGDTRGDACDPCKCDPTDSDPDGDGVCSLECDGSKDNCPNTPNPGQDNCNLVSEQAHTPSLILGDACDPVPCPDERHPGNFVAESLEGAFSEPQQGLMWFIECGYRERSGLDVRPLMSHPLDPGGTPVPVHFVFTHARFCQQNPAEGIACNDPMFDIQDDRLTDALCAPPASCALPETQDTHFHRMSFLVGGNGADPNGTPPLLSYVRAAENPKPGVEWVWNFEADLARWKTHGLVTNATTAFDLFGVRWLHGQTQVGNTIDVGTGLHGEQLANNHREMQVKKPECHTTSPIAVWPELPWDLAAIIDWQFIPDPPPDPFIRHDADPGETSIVLSVGPGEWGVLDHQGRVERVTDRLGPHLVARLSDPSLRWVNAAEPFAGLGAGAAFPLAVALSADGSDIVDSVATNGAMLGADLDRLLVRSPTIGSPHATGYAAVLSRMRRGVWVVGGYDPDTGAPTGEIWFSEAMKLQENVWNRVDTGSYAPEHVLAATYSFASDALYVLDVTTAGVTRLVAIDPDTLAHAVVGEWPWTGAWSRQYLAVDRDGALLLASSTTAKKKQHRIARIDVRTDPPSVRVVSGNRALVRAPVVDGGGYTLVLEQSQGNNKVKVERKHDLGGVVASLTSLGAQL